MLLAAIGVAIATVERRLTRKMIRCAEEIRSRLDCESEFTAAEFATLRRQLASTGVSSDSTNGVRSPRLVAHWVNREVAMFLAIFAIAGIGGWLAFPDTESPAKFKAQTFSAGISAVPDTIEVREYHGRLPDGYGRSWPGTGYDSRRFEEIYDNSAANADTVTFDLVASYPDAFDGRTRIAIVFDVPLTAEMQMCQGWSSNTPFKNAVPNDFRATIQPFQPIDCHTEKKRDGEPVYFVGYGTYQDLADPDQRRTKIAVTAPAGTTRLAFHLRFSGIKGIGFSTTPTGAETHFPQFAQIATQETGPYRAPYRGTPSIADTRVITRYWVPDADQAEWAGTAPEANATQATWDYTALDTPTNASATFQNVVSSNTTATFFVGLVLGISGAALLSALQASFTHGRSVALLSANQRSA